MASRGADIVGVLEAAYSGASDEEAWLDGVLRCATPLLDQGLGVHAQTFTRTEDDRVLFGCARGLDERTRPLCESARATHDALCSTEQGRAVVQRLYPAVPHAGLFSERAALGDAWLELPMAGALTDAGHAAPTLDAFGVVGASPTGPGCVLVAMVPPGRVLPRERVAAWQHVAAHLAAGYRLLRARSAAPDAILDPTGRVAHVAANEVAPREREVLSDATRAIDRARGKLRRAAPDEALAIWRALVAGRWTLVDQFDDDGRRYVVARRNAPEVRAWGALTERERQVVAYAAHGQSHKAIAYTLGISVSTVGAHLASAARKIGARSRLELVAAHRRATDGGASA